MADSLTYVPDHIVTIVATADLPERRFVGLSGGLCGLNAKALGVCIMATDSDKAAPVCTSGTVIVECAGNISVGNAVVSNASGKALAATTFSATVPAGGTDVTSTSAAPAMTLAGSVLPQVINGYALDAGSDGTFIRIKLV